MADLDHETGGFPMGKYVHITIVIEALLKKIRFIYENASFINRS
jgi:hypothetical protein